MKNFLYSLKNAYNGILDVLREENSMKIHLLMTVAVITFALFFKITLLEWTVLFLTISSVLFAEMINTSIERIMDFIGTEYNEKIGEIKDISAGAVLICSIFAAIIGLIIFLPYFSEL